MQGGWVGTVGTAPAPGSYIQPWRKWVTVSALYDKLSHIWFKAKEIYIKYLLLKAIE